MKSTLLFFLFISVAAVAQMGTDAPWIQGSGNGQDGFTYSQYKNAGEAYFSQPENASNEMAHQLFQAWLQQSQGYLKQDGNMQSPAELQQAAAGFMMAKSSPAVATDDSKWTPVGPFDFENTTSWSPGQGTVNTVVVDPSNPSTYYVGAPTGGLWKSTNAGRDWKPLTDFLSRIGVSAIAVDPSNSDIIYIGTGDDDGGDASSLGMFKSIDGGKNFLPTSLQFTGVDAIISEIYIDPSNSKKLFIATNKGLYTTYNGGTTVKKVFNGNIKDIKLQPGNSRTIYVATTSEFYTSRDGGESFFRTTTGLPNGITRMVLAVSKAAPNTIYVLAVDMSNALLGVYRSNDAGVSFARKDDGTNILESDLAWYTLALEVSQENADIVYAGCANIWKSINGGTRFEKINSWDAPDSPSYTHASIHQLRVFNNQLFAMTNGGVYKSNNDGSSFDDITAGLQIGQFLRVAVGTQSSMDISGGLQGNGGFSYSANKWKNFHGADGMEAAIDPTNPSVRYSFTQFGMELYVTKDGSSMDRKVTGPEMGSWITPMKINSKGVVYAAYKKLYKLTGNSFTPVSSNFTDNITVLEIDPINEDIMYVAVKNQLFRSTNGGTDFTWIKELPGTITAIEVNETNNNIIYVATGTTTGKVMRSDNMGGDFTDISYNLPSLGKNTLVHFANSAGEKLFLGTTVGVYQFSIAQQSWTRFTNNLPNVSITDLEVNLNDNIMTAATYGRGVWQTGISAVQASNDIALVTAVHANGSIDCSSNDIVVTLKNKGLSTISSFTLIYTINEGNPIAHQYELSIAPLQTREVAITNLNLQQGSYQVKIEATTVADEYASNNFKTIRILQNTAATVGTTYDFENAGLLTANKENSNVLWERGIPTSNRLKSAASGKKVYATKLNGNYTDKTIAYLYTGCYDLTTATGTSFQFDMAYDLEDGWDIFYVQYSLDHGQTWELLGDRTDSNWYNSTQGSNGSNCYNCTGGQWTGTDTQMKTYAASLKQVEGNAGVIFRFVMHSDDSNNQEGVILDNVVVKGATPKAAATNQDLLFSVYPNPSLGVFKLDWKMDGDYSYTVTDITGQTVAQMQATSNKMEQIDLTGLNAGMYFLTVNANGTTATKKLIVQ